MSQEESRNGTGIRLLYKINPSRTRILVPVLFLPVADYLSEGPSTDKKSDSARIKYGTGEPFTPKNLSEPNLSFGHPYQFHSCRTKNSTQCKPAFEPLKLRWLSKVTYDISNTVLLSFQLSKYLWGFTPKTTFF